MTNTTEAVVPAERRLGSILGLAYGDAIGDPVEFRKYAEISDIGVGIPMAFRVTDDTQMSLAVWDALAAWEMPATMGEVNRSLALLRVELYATFLAWYHDPDNNRAPGATCMSALRMLEDRGLGSWTLATSATSAGCGSVMRAPWIGLSDKLTDDMVERVAALQAVLTHGNAESYTAAAAARLTRAIARDEVAPGQAAAWLADYSRDLARSEYDRTVLSDLWRLTKHSAAARGGHASPESYVAEGAEHVAWVAEAAARLSTALVADPWGFDPCSIAGEGWRARECLAVAVGIFDALAAYTPVEALLRAAETNGDSDSIGAVTGALVGAHAGADAFPKHWLLRVEPRYQHELMRAAGRV